MKTYAAIWTTFSLLLMAPAALASECRDVAFEDTSFTICEANPSAADVALYLNDGDGNILGTFDNLVSAIETGRVAWAMNGGMYHSDRRPVGLYIEDGREVTPLVTREGPGNFGLLPNGVLCLSDAGASVTESRAFATQDKACAFATQSGPMLVIDGALHSRFLPNSDSLNIRNGVGVTPEGTLIAAISNEPVTFHRFARLFR
ncbi:MAG: phosphodiester glycosidase family protein, partial [Pseudomonadota bacterium]